MTTFTASGVKAAVSAAEDVADHLVVAAGVLRRRGRDQLARRGRRSAGTENGSTATLARSPVRAAP